MVCASLLHSIELIKRDVMRIIKIAAASCIMDGITRGKLRCYLKIMSVMRPEAKLMILLTIFQQHPSPQTNHFYFFAKQ